MALNASRRLLRCDTPFTLQLTLGERGTRMKIEITKANLDKVESDALVVFVSKKADSKAAANKNGAKKDDKKKDSPKVSVEGVTKAL